MQLEIANPNEEIQLGKVERRVNNNNEGHKYRPAEPAVPQQTTAHRQQQGAFSFFTCCFGQPPKEVNLTDTPDDDFYADNIVKLLNGYTAYRVIEPIKPESSDPPLIVLVHGFQNSSYMWADVAELLADFDQGPMANILIYDIFGHGRSPWTGKNLSLDVLVTQIKELMECKDLFVYF
jgi:pimeloyl-ACP methyl ester carboxylesterase